MDQRVGDDEWLRRIVNIAVALVAIVVTAPLMLLVAIAVRLSSPGTALYTQWRVGVDRRAPLAWSNNGRRSEDRGGRLFRIYKFRTMYEGSDRHGQVWAVRGDSRITPVGRVLRRFRLDELPQLFNVLKGDMNVVGPRPEQPDIFARLRETIPHYPLRQRVRPGITGLAQVSQAYDQDLEDVRRKLSFDLDYIRNCTVAEDVQIMMRTFPALLGRRLGW